MGDWLRVYNAEDVVPFIEAFRKMSEQYCLDKIDVCKYAVGILGISMTQVQDTMKQVLGKRKGLSYIQQGVFVTSVGIYKKSFSTVVVMVP